MIQTKASELNSPLTTERLYLEPLTAAHADKFFTQMQDKNIYTWISAVPPESVEDLRIKWTRLESRLSPNRTEAWLNWAVCRINDGEYVGKIDAEIDFDYFATNLGYIFFPPFWGRGYAHEAINAIVNHFAKHKVKQIRATVTVGNDSSARLLEKSGFVRNRIIPNNDTIRGMKFDDIEYLRTF